MADDKSVHERRFEAAVKVMRSLPEDGTFEPSDDMLAMFYSYYKQATVGPCNTTNPNRWDSVGKAKWEAWKALGEMTKEQAMKEYVQEIQLILEAIPVTEEVSELLDELDSFYEIVEDEEEEVTTKPAILATEAERSDEEESERQEEDSDEDISSCEEEEELDDNSEDVRRSAVFKEADRGLSLVCNGRTETHSVSSVTNGTHSSLNTEEEEEELVCSSEHSLDSPQLYTCTDHIYDDTIEQKLQSEDTNSHSVEHLATKKGLGACRARLAGPRTVGAKRPEELGGSQDGEQQEALLPIPAASGPVQYERAPVNTERGCNLEKTAQIYNTVEPLSDHEVAQCVRGGPVVRKHSVNTQICAVLSGLQEDMQSVLQRLNQLETQTAAQVETVPLKSDHASVSAKNRLHWWPLNISHFTVALALLWPVAVHWLVQLYLQKKRRRIK